MEVHEAMEDLHLTKSKPKIGHLSDNLHGAVLMKEAETCGSPRCGRTLAFVCGSRKRVAQCGRPKLRFLGEELVVHRKGDSW